MALGNTTELSGGARLSSDTCQDCGKHFIYFPAKLVSGQAPKRCPRCQDIRQGRPSVVEERREVAFYGAVEVVSLPGSWEEFSTSIHGDNPINRIIVKGKKFGASWEGRIDIYASRPISPGEVVNIREMEVVHRVKVVHESRPTMEHGTVTITRRVPITSTEGEETLDRHHYLVLEPVTGVEPKTRLIWVTAHTKTTLKGFGRQYWAAVSGAPVARWSVRGGARSGRYHTDGALAIVDGEHPLVVTISGDIQEEEVYN